MMVPDVDGAFFLLERKILSGNPKFYAESSFYVELFLFFIFVALIKSRVVLTMRRRRTTFAAAFAKNNERRKKKKKTQK